MSYYAGLVSAGALGYINNNIKGARDATISYRNYMARSRFSTPRVRRTMSFNPHNPHRVFRTPQTSSYGGSRRSSGSSLSMLERMRRGSASSSRFTTRRRQTVQKATDRNPRVKRGKGTLSKKKRDVKVPRRLRKQVMKVIEADKCKGYFQETFTEGLTVNAADVQVPYCTPSQCNASSTNNAGVLFDPAYFQNAAAVMWNGVTNVQSKPAVLTSSATQNAFTTEALRLEVINSYATQVYRNITQRTYELKIYTCAPRSLQVNNNAGVLATVSYGLNPLYAWNTELNSLSTSGAAGTAGIQGQNVNQITSSQLHTSPKMCPGWNKSWKADITTVVLEPGQTYTHRIQGPQNYHMNYAKFYDGGMFVNQQKCCRYVMAIITTDVVANVAGTYFGRAGDVATNNIVVETTVHTKMAIPPNAGGFPNSVANSTTVLNLVKDAFYVKDWTYVFAGTVNRFDEENPGVL
nr:MAG: capsid protein [Cressdnaviricota sp.]